MLYGINAFNGPFSWHPQIIITKTTGQRMERTKDWARLSMAEQDWGGPCKQPPPPPPPHIFQPSTQPKCQAAKPERSQPPGSCQTSCPGHRILSFINQVFGLIKSCVGGKNSSTTKCQPVESSRGSWKKKKNQWRKSNQGSWIQNPAGAGTK